MNTLPADFDQERSRQLKEVIAQFCFTREVRFVDTDASGFAHFGSYIRMMEETEYAFLRSRGLCVVLRDGRGTMGFPRLSADLNIIRPLTNGEIVEVQLCLVYIDGKQIEYTFDLTCQQKRVAQGSFKVALCRFPADNLPYAILIPDHVIDALTQKQINS